MKSNLDISKTENFFVLSISYEKADAQIRGKFSFFEGYVKEFINRVNQKKLGDVFVVSTCNRVEIYTMTLDYTAVVEQYCQMIGVEVEEFFTYAKIFQGNEALLHLFRVAGGLESQILGDFEIIGQIKNAYARFKKEKKKSNAYMERAINSAIQISKKIKNETQISSGVTSVAYAAVHYVLHCTSNINHKNILLLGVGEIGQNTVDNLIKHIDNPNIKIANRNNEKAEKIAEKYNIPSIVFEDFKKELPFTDILIVATGAKEPIVYKDDLISGKEMLIIDLSVPHNVDKNTTEIQGVSLVDVDLLSQQIEKTMSQRKQEIPKAEKIIDEMMNEFKQWEKTRVMVPKIHNFKAILKNIERNEMHNIHKKHRYVGIDDMELSEKLIQKITNRFAKYIIENPTKADEISNIMHEILVEQPNREFNEKH